MEATNIGIRKQIEDFILHYIDSRNLQPGDPIPSQRQIGKEFGASQFPVNSVTQQLIKSGVLEKIGMKVAVSQKSKNKTAKTNTIGIFYWSDEESFYKNSFYQNIMAGTRLQADREEKTLRHKSLMSHFKQGTMQQFILDETLKLDGILLVDLIPKMLDQVVEVLRSVSIPAVIMITAN